jgi:hypothetical protein
VACPSSSKTDPRPLFVPQIGPVHLNLSPFFKDMPIRYTLRSTRRVTPPAGGPAEEEVFATVSFQLVE